MAKVNWRQAVAEVGLLALGATIAIGADAWVGSNRDRAAEHVYLESLRGDLEDSRRMALEYVADNRGSIDATVALLAALAAPPNDVSEDSLTTLTANAFWIYYWNPVRGTYQDMINSGSLSLVGDVELRAALARTDELHGNVTRMEDLQWLHWTDFELPFLQTRTDLGQTYQDYASNAVERGVVVQPTHFPAAELATDEAALRSLEFRNIVVARSLVHQDAIANAMIAIQSFDSLLPLIDRELGRFD